MRQGLGLADMAREIFIARSLACLTFQAGQLSFHFADHIFQSRQIGFGGAQPELRFMAALVQTANAGGFLQNGAARQWLLGYQQADLALANKGGRTCPRRGIGEEDLHIALTHIAAIDPIDTAGHAHDAA